MAEEQQPQKLTTIFQRNAEAYLNPQIRRALNEGGTSSSKTYSILQLLDQIAQHAKTDLTISVVSESMPHLKRGCIKDFKAILGDRFREEDFNKTEAQYHYKNAVIEFFGADESSKVRGPRREILFINETNNVPWETARNLDIRTSQFTFADWNPVSQFWVHDNWLDKPENVYIHSTYLDSKWVLPVQTIKDIEAYRDVDPNWWNVYGLGRLGKVEGLVYPYFGQVDAMPEGGDEVYGLDFGYSNDPTALVRCVIKGTEMYCDELIYEAGLTNDMIAHRMIELGTNKNTALIFADAAEPKSIEEIHRFGFNVKSCAKGADSVEFGHQKIRQYKQFWTKSSLNAIKEQRNFRYIQDKDGKFTDKTTHTFSHIMDARRYAIMGNRTKAEIRWI